MGGDNAGSSASGDSQPGNNAGAPQQIPSIPTHPGISTHPGNIPGGVPSFPSATVEVGTGVHKVELSIGSTTLRIKFNENECQPLFEGNASGSASMLVRSCRNNDVVYYEGVADCSGEGV